MRLDLHYAVLLRYAQELKAFTIHDCPICIRRNATSHNYLYNVAQGELRAVP